MKTESGEKNQRKERTWVCRFICSPEISFGEFSESKMRSLLTVRLLNPFQFVPDLAAPGDGKFCLTFSKIGLSNSFQQLGAWPMSK